MLNQSTFIILFIILFCLNIICFALIFRKKYSKNNKSLQSSLSGSNINKSIHNQADTQRIYFENILSEYIISEETKAKLRSSIQTIITKITTEKLRYLDKLSIEKSVTNVMNSIIDFISKHKSNQYFTENLSLTYINQGINNIIIKINKTFLRIRKHIEEYMFRDSVIVFNILKSKAQDKHILIPNSLIADSNKHIIYYIIPELQPINKLILKKFTIALEDIYAFLLENRSLTYKDFKYSNFMLNDNNEYILVDIDFMKASNILNKIPIKNTTIDDIDIQGYFGQEFDSLTILKFYIYPIIALFCKESNSNKVNYNNLPKQYDPKLLISALSIRTFYFQILNDFKNNSFNANESSKHITATKELIKYLSSLNSTAFRDVFS